MRSLFSRLLLLTVAGAALSLGPTICGVAEAFDWVPSDEEIQKYRRSWNPMATGRS